MSMDRIEAYRRIDAAVVVLCNNGWTGAEIERAVSGLDRDDAVSLVEREARACLGLSA